jgi:dTDP-4-amino-4,6-dideoxygalactose transaminase
MIKICDLTQPPEVYEAVKKVIDGGVFIKGPLVTAFEEKWAFLCRMKYGIGVSSGAIALELVIQAFKPIKIQSTFPFTYKAVWNAIDRVNGSHRFVGKFDMPDIYAHHLHECKMYGKSFIEDCSHCHGYQPRADTAIFSLYPTKILGAIGDAGIIVTNSEEIANKCRVLRDHGEPYGTNGRMDEIQAAALLVKLKYLPKYILRRQEIVKIYDKAFGLKTPGSFHYAYAIKGSNEMAKKLLEMGIETRFYYNEEHMALPLHPLLTDEEVRKVIQCVQSL